MIILDTSALIAILKGEAEAARMEDSLSEADGLLISAGTAAEAMIVAGQRGYRNALEAMLTRFGIVIVPVTASDVVRVADAYARWGKGNHPAALNLGDCFAYALARERGCPLLFVGNDFSQTDIEAA